MQILLTPKNNTSKAYDGTLSNIQQPHEATPSSDIYGGGAQSKQPDQQQVSKHTINSFNQSNLSNFYNSLGASGQVAPTAGGGSSGIYKNSKLNSATTADSSQNDYQRQLSMMSKQSPIGASSGSGGVPSNSSHHQRYKSSMGGVVGG